MKNNINQNNERVEERNYSYYSKVLKKPFDSLRELKEAEAAYYTELKAKEDKAATKKADAAKVEEAFKALNTTRRVYKESLLKMTEKYSADLKKLKETFEADKREIQDILETSVTRPQMILALGGGRRSGRRLLR